MEVTREEVSLERELQSLLNGREKRISVCFVCTGNTCRSPMAEAMLKHLGGGAYKVCSAGVSAVTGDKITVNAVKALKKAGIPSTPENNYEAHEARMIDAAIMDENDMIVAITENHMLNLLLSFPEYADKISVMPKDIPDPFMFGEAVYDRCLEEITACIKEKFGL